MLNRFAHGGRSYKDAVLMLVVMGSANLSHQDGVRPTIALTSGYLVRQLSSD